MESRVAGICLYRQLVGRVRRRFTGGLLHWCVHLAPSNNITESSAPAYSPQEAPLPPDWTGADSKKGCPLLSLLLVHQLRPIQHQHIANPSFQMLQNRSGSSGSLVFYAFDLLNFEGQDWRRKPLTERQSKLAQVVEGSAVRVSPPLAGSAAVVISAVREHGLEGVVAKRKDSFYQPGERSGAWQKLPLKPKDEFVIGGYRLEDKNLEVLLVGRFEGAKLLLAGKVHQGLNQFNRKTLLNVLRPLSVAECPFANLPSSRRGHFGEGVRAEEMGEYSWVKLKIMATVKFAEWTDAGVLRHAEFEGLVTEDVDLTVQAP
jgi:ATP-dependent DNA ligase